VPRRYILHLDVDAFFASVRRSSILLSKASPSPWTKHSLRQPFEMTSAEGVSD
jgi:hypothetical protein